MPTSPYPKAVRIAVLVVGVLVGLVLMGGAPDGGSRIDEVLGFVALATMVGAWLFASWTPLSNSLAMAAQAANQAELRELDAKLVHFETPALLMKKGETLIASNQARKAIAPLERALELDDSDIHAHYLLGQAYYAAARYTDAWRCFDRVYRADAEHDYASIRLWAARTYLQMDEPAHAVMLAESYLGKEKGHLGAIALRADALWAQGKTAEAVAGYQEFLRGYATTTPFSQNRYKREAAVAKRRAR
ncbi:MAG: tetratricopeptide repeat protein [Planctomycetota bacterium]